MMFAFLLLALAVSGLGVWTSRRWQMFGQALTVVGGLSLIIIVAVQVRQNLFPPQEESPGRCELAVGSCLGDFVGGDLDGQRGTVILLFPSQMSAHLEQSYEQGFVLSLRHGHGALHLKALHLDAEKGHAGCSLAALKKALAQVPDALAYVSYAGAPPGFDTLFSADQPAIAPFYVFDAQGTTNWLSPLKNGRVRAVVLPRPGVAPRAREAATGMPEAILDQFYLVATQPTADQVTAQLGMTP
jgi:hypothetical protein